MIPNEFWKLIEPLMPSDEGKRGRRFGDHRLILEGIAWRFRTGSPWRGNVLEAAIALAGRITANGPLTVAATKRMITHLRGWSPDEMWAQQARMPVFSSNDAKEGAIAFAEKRPPKWTGN